MVTFVGTQDDFGTALVELIELDFDAVAAYTAAIDRLTNEEYKQKLREFRDDHERHIRELSAVLLAHNQKAPTGPDHTKQWLSKGKVIIAELMGDQAILAAMRSNEVDTNTAYERIVGHKNKWPDSDDIVRRGLQDEKRHKTWLDSQG
jgi:rubrerythrin